MVGREFVGTPTTAGSYPIVFAGLDGLVAEVTISRTFAVATATGFKAIRITPTRSYFDSYPTSDPSCRLGIC